MGQLIYPTCEREWRLLAAGVCLGAALVLWLNVRRLQREIDALDAVLDVLDRVGQVARDQWKAAAYEGEAWETPRELTCATSG